MRKHLALNILLILQAMVLFQSFVFADTTAITHVTVIDGNDGALKPNMTVIITGDRISSIQQTNDQRFQADVIDGTGKFLIPGLWDMHAHLTNYSETACPALVAKWCHWCSGSWWKS
jgi:alpha-D-ribose 1-methylphosphonate 5-triphosphate diphosphatase PhnM